MSRRDKLYLVLGIGFFLASLLMVTLLGLSGDRKAVTWAFSKNTSQEFREKAEEKPPVLEIKGSRVVQVGRTVFIKAIGTDHDTAVLLNGTILDKGKYTVASNEGIYLQAPSEGVFLLSAVNRAGVSNSITFEVSNSYNINLLYPIDFLDRYSDITLVSDSLILKLNTDGQATDRQGFLSRLSDYAVIRVDGVSKKTGRKSTIGWAIKDPNKSVFGLVIDSNTTAEYLVNRKLVDLNQLGLKRRLTNSEILAVAEVAAIIKNYTYEASDIDLNSELLDNQLIKVVRKIRKSRL